MEVGGEGEMGVTSVGRVDTFQGSVPRVEVEVEEGEGVVEGVGEEATDVSSVVRVDISPGTALKVGVEEGVGNGEGLAVI